METLTFKRLKYILERIYFSAKVTVTVAWHMREGPLLPLYISCQYICNNYLTSPSRELMHSTVWCGIYAWRSLAHWLIILHICDEWKVLFRMDIESTSPERFWWVCFSFWTEFGAELNMNTKIWKWFHMKITHWLIWYFVAFNLNISPIPLSDKSKLGDSKQSLNFKVHTTVENVWVEWK